MVRASDRHPADVGLIPWCGKGFFFHSQLSVQTLLRVSVHPLCATACINICAHVKDPVVHVGVRWIMEILKHPACTVGWVARLCRSWLSPRKQPKFSMKEIPMGQYSCKFFFSGLTFHEHFFFQSLSLVLTFGYNFKAVPEVSVYGQIA